MEHCFSRSRGGSGPFIALLLALVIAIIATGWYFGYTHELRIFRLSLGGCIGIAVVVLLRIVKIVKWYRRPGYTREFEEQQRFQFWKKP
jgi:hypothetical protein